MRAKDAKLLSILKNLDDVLYSAWRFHKRRSSGALKSGIRLRVSSSLFLPSHLTNQCIVVQNLFGSTEIGGMLCVPVNTKKNHALLKALPGTSYRFSPIEESAEGVQTTAVLYELIILADSPDCLTGH